TPAGGVTPGHSVGPWAGAGADPDFAQIKLVSCVTPVTFALTSFVRAELVCARAGVVAESAESGAADEDGVTPVTGYSARPRSARPRLARPRLARPRSASPRSASPNRDRYSKPRSR